MCDMQIANDWINYTVMMQENFVVRFYKKRGKENTSQITHQIARKEFELHPDVWLSLYHRILEVRISSDY